MSQRLRPISTIRRSSTTSRGKSKAFNFFTTVPFGLTAPTRCTAWLYYGGGQELWDDAGGPVQPEILGRVGNTGVQMGGWYNREINTLEDYKGLKIRMPGLGGEVLRNMGASVVNLAGGENLPGTAVGRHRRHRRVGPYNDLAFGFYKVAKYYYYPGFHEPGTVLSAGMNKGVWDSLSDGHKAIVEAAMQAETHYMLAEFNARNGDALKTLVDEHGVQLREFSDEIMLEIRKISEQVVADVAARTRMRRKPTTASRRSATRPWPGTRFPKDPTPRPRPLIPSGRPFRFGGRAFSVILL